MKTALVNAYIRSLPADAFLVYPDADELFEYSTLALEFFRQPTRTVMCGSMVDRVASDFSLPPIRVGIPLEQQFPVCTRMRHLIPGQSAYKLVAVRTRPNGVGLLQYRNSHTAWVLDGKCSLAASESERERAAEGGILGSAPAGCGRNASSAPCHLFRCPVGGHVHSFAHYQFSEEALNLTVRKKQIYANKSSIHYNRNNANVYRSQKKLFVMNGSGVHFSAAAAAQIRRYRLNCS